MFILDPDPYSLPCYKIGPFQTKHISENHYLPSSNIIDDYLNNKFNHRSFIYTDNGRKAINIALNSYDLRKDDVVTILTTSGNLYISSCVTKEIEKFCKWSREIVSKTRIIFINHEFGYIYPEMDKIVKFNLPIIEDCCTTFFSQNSDGLVGNYGDYSIYSFPKFFPIQIGGLLVNNKSRDLSYKSFEYPEMIDYIKRVISNSLKTVNQLLINRKQIYDYGISLYKSLGFTERFVSSKYVIPSVTLLNNNNLIKNLDIFKSVLWSHGIQSSIFYGEDAFFLPSHQNLSRTDIQYFIEVLKYSIKSIK